MSWVTPTPCDGRQMWRDYSIIILARLARNLYVDKMMVPGKMQPCMPEWRNWQTRYVQGVVAVKPSGFNSQLRHQENPGTLRPGFFVARGRGGAVARAAV